MDALWLVLGLASALWTVIATLIMVFRSRQERPVGKLAPLWSAALSLLMLPVLTLLGGMRLTPVLAWPALLIGLAIGLVRGQATRLYYKDGQAVARSSMLFLLGWGLSLAIAQLCDLLGSTLLSSLALLPVYLSAGTQAGIGLSLFLRRRRMRLPGAELAAAPAALGLPER